MKKIFFFLSVLAICTTVNAQKNKTVELSYILKGSTDTIKKNCYVSTNLFKKNLIDPLSFDKILIIEENSRKKKIKEKDIKWMTFIDFEDKKRIFKDVPEINAKDELFEEIINGKITWYAQYVRNFYDGSTVVRNYFIKDGKEPIFCGFIDLCKKKMYELLSDKSEIAEEWENTKPKTPKNLLGILEKYNSTTN